jgi:hypothetical protein
VDCAVTFEIKIPNTKNKKSSNNHWYWVILLSVDYIPIPKEGKEKTKS